MRVNKSTVKTIITMVCIAGLIILAYFYISGREDDSIFEKDYVETEVDKLINKDLDNDYPVTAREVLKFYSRILVCLHSETLSDTQIEALVDQIRKLYSSELLFGNQRDVHIQQIKDELILYGENEQTITNYQVEKAQSAITWTRDNVKYYRLIASFVIKKNGRVANLYEEFILMEEDSRFKILGWKAVDGSDMDAN